ncbi:alpha/beta-hydrolase [Ascobolus immersus RN42]|uniref:Alpha/beta-hydrolase n=1 Tax=Ascobolus immersus RN42 TaxID=1160509 RepID=A0A3N4ICQ1_ASCIM|nr:alpha/beta-hydrolase [Ascobolus immersus RN42]
MRLLLTPLFATLTLANTLELWPGQISTFLATPQTTASEPTSIILLIPDIYGHNSTATKTLAQKISTLSNLIVVVPDVFEGEPIPEGGAPSFPPGWQDRHGPAQVERVLDLTLAEVKRRWGEVKVGATGYCFGGRYVFRYLSAGKIAAGVAAHPSSTTIDEIVGAKGPIQIATAATDPSFPPAIRQQAEAALAEKVPYEMNTYGGVGHGFAVRASDPSDRRDVYALESAAENAVAWFKFWLE